MSSFAYIQHKDQQQIFNVYFLSDLTESSFKQATHKNNGYRYCNVIEDLYCVMIFQWCLYYGGDIYMLKQACRPQDSPHSSTYTERIISSTFQTHRPYFSIYRFRIFTEKDWELPHRDTSTIWLFWAYFHKPGFRLLRLEADYTAAAVSSTTTIHIIDYYQLPRYRSSFKLGEYMCTFSRNNGIRQDSGSVFRPVEITYSDGPKVYMFSMTD